MDKPIPSRTVRTTPALKREGGVVVGTALRWVWWVVGTAAVVVSVCLIAFANSALPFSRQTTQPSHVTGRDDLLADIPQVSFTDITSASGIRFRHRNGARGEKLLPETMGGGCAFLDYDSDGDQDLLFVNSELSSEGNTGTTNSPATMALYRNDGRGNFEDVTTGSGLDVAMYGMGAAVGDYDNDGRIDVFLSAVGANKLFRNLGEGKFVDVTVATGVAGEPDEWSSGCGWFDFDNDGDLDLFVCNYVKWTREQDLAQNFRMPDGHPAYGRPQNFEGAFPYLYRNDGLGKFTDVSREAGLQVRDPVTGAAASKSLGVTFEDLDGDGWFDIVVANDTVQNQLFRNLGNGKFEECGALAGIAFDEGGSVRGAMGIDSARFRNDDALGIAIGNFSNEMMALYVAASGDMQFTDEAAAVGLGPSTQIELTFGTFFVDYDLDGSLDLFAANGHLEPEINRAQPSQHYEQAPQLFWNGGSSLGGTLVPVSNQKSGPDFAKAIVGRGASFADIDGDGDLDLLITANGQAPRLLRNDQKLGHHWLRLKLVGADCNRDAIGAEVEVHLQDRALRRRVMPTRSYLSQVELPLTFGLGRDDRVQSITIRWPDGSTQFVHDIEIDRTFEIEQRSGSVTAIERSSDERSWPVAKPATIEELRDGQPLMSSVATTSCGDYLHVNDHARNAGHRRPSSPRPCQGPMCSKAPLDQHVPPSAPIRQTHQQQDALAGVDHHPRSKYRYDLQFWDSDVLPEFARGTIFRPPRCG